MRKTFLRMGSLFALLSVAFGAFGAHSLKEFIAVDQLQSFEVGVRYQFYHSIVLFALGILLYYRKTKFMMVAGYLFVAGIILFSGSLYLLALQEIFGLPIAFLGPITPLGGLCFIAGWALLFLSTYQDNEKHFRKSES